MHRIDRILAWALSSPWAILPERGAAILQVLARRSEGVVLSPAEVQEVVGADVDATAARVARDSAVARSGGGVAVLPVFGVIIHRSYEVSCMSGGGTTSLERFTKALRTALADPGVGSIVIDIDSPGGNVEGVTEAFAAIAAAEKPVVAVANSMAASAAYWLASAAQELVVSPSAQVGSIGVYTMHEDHSRELEAAGIGVQVIKAGKFKAEGLPVQPLSEEARAALQRSVNEYYEMFVRDVATGRGVKPAAVRDGFGEGRIVGAKEAVSLGMADRIATLDETIQRLAAGGRVKPRRASAEASGAEVLPAPPAPSSIARDDLDLRARELDLSSRGRRLDPTKQGPTLPRNP